MRENRCKSVGDLGEELAHELLLKGGFQDICNLNHPSRNYPYVDFEARRQGRLYLVSVKARNRYQVNGLENPTFNLVKKIHRDAIVAMERQRAAIFASLALQLEAPRGLFSAYFGTWDQIGRTRLSIPMLPRYTATYECLAKQQQDPRIEAWLDNGGLPLRE